METERENIVRDGHRWTGKGIIRHHDEPGASWAVMRSDQTRFSIQRFRGVRFILELNAVDRGAGARTPRIRAGTSTRTGYASRWRRAPVSTGIDRASPSAIQLRSLRAAYPNQKRRLIIAPETGPSGDRVAASEQKIPPRLSPRAASGDGDDCPPPFPLPPPALL